MVTAWSLNRANIGYQIAIETKVTYKFRVQGGKRARVTPCCPLASSPFLVCSTRSGFYLLPDYNCHKKACCILTWNFSASVRRFCYSSSAQGEDKSTPCIIPTSTRNSPTWCLFSFFRTKIYFASFVSPTRVPYPAHLIVSYLLILIKCGGHQKLWRCFVILLHFD